MLLRSSGRWTLCWARSIADVELHQVLSRQHYHAGSGWQHVLGVRLYSAHFLGTIGRSDCDELAGAKNSSAHAGPPWPNARRTARPAATDCRCHKILIKEDIMPSQADGFVFWVGPIICVI